MKSTTLVRHNRFKVAMIALLVFLSYGVPQVYAGRNPDPEAGGRGDRRSEGR